MIVDNLNAKKQNFQNPIRNFIITEISKILPFYIELKDF